MNAWLVGFNLAIAVSALLFFAVAWVRRKRRWQAAMASHCAYAALAEQAFRSDREDLGREFMQRMTVAEDDMRREA